MVEFRGTLTLWGFFATDCFIKYEIELLCTSYSTYCCIWERTVWNETFRYWKMRLQVKHCNTLQHTATHCNTLQRTATQCNTLQLDRTVTHKIVSLSTKDRTYCRVAKTHRMPIFPGHFPFKFPIISGRFPENDLHLMVSYGSSPPCIRERFLEMRL